jgi:hypothetical protein
MPGHQHRCPQCDSAIFIHVPFLSFEATPARELPQVLTTALRGQPPNVLRLHFTAQVCLACGRAELYASDVQDLCTLASDPNTGVVVLDVTAAGEI